MSDGPDAGLPSSNGSLSSSKRALPSTSSGNQIPRVRVTAATPAPPTRPAFDLGARAAEAPTSDIEGVYVRSLIRSQLRLGLVFAVGFVSAALLFVLAIVLVPGLDETAIAGVPVSWLLLGFGLYPLVITVAALYQRAANRNEARFRALAGRP